MWEMKRKIDGNAEYFHHVNSDRLNTTVCRNWVIISVAVLYDQYASSDLSCHLTEYLLLIRLISAISSIMVLYSKWRLEWNGKKAAKQVDLFQTYVKNDQTQQGIIVPNCDSKRLVTFRCKRFRMQRHPRKFAVEGLHFRTPCLFVSFWNEIANPYPVSLLVFASLQILLLCAVCQQYNRWQLVFKICT